MIGATKILRLLINGAAKNSTIPNDPFCRNSTIPDDPYCKKFCNFWRPILIAEILQSLMNQAAYIQSMMTYTADILSP